MTDNQGFIPPHGGYKELVSYQKAVIVYDATVEFCARFIGKRDRTYDQMVQAARSGKQNIIEGSMASAVSRKTEIRLTNVARASLEELLEDYHDFLRCRRAAVWHKDSKEARYVRRLSRQATPGRRKNETDETNGTDVASSHNAPHSSHMYHPSHSPYEHFRPFIETRPPEVVANIMICLIHQTNYLLDQQIRQLEKDFIEHGGLSEAMNRARLANRDKQRRGR